MRVFSVMLTSAKGDQRQIKFGPVAMASALLLALTLVTFGGWGAYAVYQSKQQLAWLDSAQYSFTNKGNLPAQEAARLRDQLALEQKKVNVYARTLGQMEARLARLDALGSKLVNVAKLDKSEFDFGLKPAIGGPRLHQASMSDLDEHLDDNLSFIDQRLGRLDAQLSVIEYALQKKNSLASAKPHAWPTEGGYISSHFGVRIDPFTGERARHEGVDIANRYGAPVYAAARGIVTYAGGMEDFGYMVEIDHGYGYKTRYGHLSGVIAKVGDVVEEGQLIGRVGSTGRSTGPHLHYEVHLNGGHINPAGFLPRG